MSAHHILIRHGWAAAQDHPRLPPRPSPASPAWPLFRPHHLRHPYLRYLPVGLRRPPNAITHPALAVVNDALSPVRPIADAAARLVALLAPPRILLVLGDVWASHLGLRLRALLSELTAAVLSSRTASKLLTNTRGSTCPPLLSLLPFSSHHAGISDQPAKLFCHSSRLKRRPRVIPSSAAATVSP